MQLSENVITAVILFSLIGSFLINLIADVLNLRYVKDDLPQEFKGIYDTQKYLKSQEYLKTNTRFGYITSIFDLTIVLTFWFAGGFAFLDTLVRSLGLGHIITGLLYIGILMGTRMVLSLPFTIYNTFGIEERFGFNKTTPFLFVQDLFKSICLSVIIGAAVLAPILWFLNSAGSMGWIFCWIAGTLFLFTIQYIVPTWIMPLFNRFTPLEDGPLKDAIFSYARSIQFPLAQIFIMDGSKRSSKSNAFFTGFGRNRRIVLFDTLVKEQSVDELVAVLAHEMGHFKKKHIIKRIGLSILQMGLIFYLMSLFLSNQALFNAFYVTTPSVYAGLIFFGLLYTPIDLVLSVFMQISSRKDEYEADRFAAVSLKDSAALISALKKLSVHNLSNLLPHPFYVFLNYSHPPVMERIRALKTY
jgi:STE24 endopeptidase